MAALALMIRAGRGEYFISLVKEKMQIEKIKKIIKKMKKTIDKIKKIMYYISMETIRNTLETFEKRGKIIKIIERWIFEESKMKKPKKQWIFMKEEKIKVKDGPNNTMEIENLIEYKEYKSKQAVYKRYNKEKNILKEK